MLDFPNIKTESDFIRAYKYQLSRLMLDIHRYVSVHGFEKQKYDELFADRLGAFYYGLTGVLDKGQISSEVMEALAFLYYKEVLDLRRAFRDPVDDDELVLAEYNRTKHLHLLDV